MPATADWGYNQLQANLGGPVSFIPGMNYYISGEIQGAKDRTPTHASEGFRGVNEDFVKHLNDAVADDPILGAGPEPAYTLDMFKTGKEFYASKTGADPGLFTPFNPVRLPINWMDRTLGSGKLTYAPGKNLKLIFTSNMSRNQHTYPAGLHMGQGSYYATGIATISQIPNSPWWDMSDDTTLTMTQSQSRRTKTFNYLSGFDWNFYSTAERQGSLQFRYSNMRTQDINNATLRANYERDTFLSWSYHDIPFEIESYPNREMPYSAEDRAQYVPDGITGWKNDFIYVTPFAATTDQGDTWLYLLRYRYSYEKQNNYKVDMGFQLDKHNRAKTGLQVTTLNNHSFNMGAESAQRDLGNEFRYDPKIYAFYLQNRTDLGDFVLDYGLRYDFFKPEDNWGLRSGDQFEEIFYPKTIKALSPRFDVAFPVTDKSQLRFSYGTFAQLPGMEFLFTSGNAGDLEYSRTDAFEMGISRLLSDDIVLDFVAFYRDVTGNVASKEYFRDYYRWHAERWVRDWVTGYTNRDNGNIKGIDIALRKRFSKNFAFDATYTLQFSRTTGSHHVSTGYLIDFMDTSTGERFTPPDEIRPINGDRTHNLNVNFNYLFPEDFLAGTKGNLILGDLRINAILKLMSGQPIDNLVQSYTGEVRYRYMTYRGGKPIGGLNYFRSDWFYNLDLRFSKSFRLTNTRRLSFFGEIFNALNRKGANPYPSGYGLTSSNLTVIGGTDRAWEDDWNNDVITRSRFQCDFNGDGVLTVMEAAKGAIADQLMESTMDKKRWGRARQVRFGLEIAF